MITTLDRYSLHPGRVVEWTMRPLRPAAASPDFRAPSYLQEDHLRAEVQLRRSGAGGGSWLAAGFDLPGRVESEEMQAVLLSVIGRHESLRSELRFVDGRLARFTYPESEIELREKVVGEFGTGAEIARYLEARFDEATDPLVSALPSMFACVVREERTTVLAASDHSRTDGYSIFLAPHEIHELHAAHREQRDPDGLAEVGSHADFSHAERTQAAGIASDHPGVLVWQDFLGKCGGALPDFPLERGVPAGAMPGWAGLHEPLLDATGTDAFDGACSVAGGHFLSGLAAAVAIAVRELGGPTQFHTTIPVHTRTRAQWAAAQGWFVNSLPVSIPTADGQQFSDVVHGTRTALRHALPARKVPCSRAWELTGVTPLLRNMISFMDLRGTAGSEHWAEWNVACIGKPPPGDHVFFWFLRTHEGLSITAVYPDTHISQQTLPDIIRRIRRIMTTVAETGSYEVQRRAARGDVHGVAAGAAP